VDQCDRIDSIIIEEMSPLASSSVEYAFSPGYHALGGARYFVDFAVGRPTQVLIK
jgi:hypothetical protein